MSWKEKLQTFLESTTALLRRTGSDAAPGTTVTKTMKPPQELAANAPSWQQRYERVRKLDAGGMGTVLLARRRSDALPVCLKFLNPNTDRRSTEQECRALLRLRHPAIVSLLDFSLTESTPWLATEYIGGTTLRTHLKQHAPLPVETVREILRQILGALAYAHGERVIHRDLKPSNLMIDGSESGVRMRILDFGIAIVDEYDHQGNLTAQGADPLGTLLYMAPEQLQGQLLTPACDVYTLGLIAWEMLTGQSVFEGKTRSQMLFEKVTRAEGFVVESELVPADLRSFVQAATVPAPSARPSAAEALAMLA